MDGYSLPSRSPAESSRATTPEQAGVECEFSTTSTIAPPTPSARATCGASVLLGVQGALSIPQGLLHGANGSRNGYDLRSRFVVHTPHTSKKDCMLMASNSDHSPTRTPSLEFLSAPSRPTIRSHPFQLPPPPPLLPHPSIPPIFLPLALEPPVPVLQQLLPQSDRGDVSVTSSSASSSCQSSATLGASTIRSSPTIFTTSSPSTSPLARMRLPTLKNASSENVTPQEIHRHPRARGLNREASKR